MDRKNNSNIQKMVAKLRSISERGGGGRGAKCYKVEASTNAVPPPRTPYPLPPCDQLWAIYDKPDTHFIGPRHKPKTWTREWGLL